MAIGYNTKINIEGEDAYSNINWFVDKIAFRKGFSKDGLLYFTDKNYEGVIKISHRNKTAELTDKVEEWIFDTINELNEIE